MQMVLFLLSSFASGVGTGCVLGWVLRWRYYLRGLRQDLANCYQTVAEEWDNRRMECERAYRQQPWL